MTRTRIITLVALALVFAPSGLYLWNRTHVTRTHTLERKLELTDLATEAQLVVVATPVKSKSRIVNNDTAGSLVYTDWTVDVQDTLKGNAPKLLVVTVPGGERFGQKTIADQFDGFKKGTQYVMYLTYIPEGKWWTPLSTTQAVFEQQGSTFTDASGRSQTPDAARLLIQQAVVK